MVEKEFYKRNYLETFKIISPEVYTTDDINLSGSIVSNTDQLINSHIVVANNIEALLNISATTNFSSINTFDGISQYFFKQNNLTKFTPTDFWLTVLNKFNKNYSDFATSAVFEAYLNSTVLPSILLNEPSSTVFNLNSSATHEYLINNLGWFYLLNTSSISGTTDPSTLIAEPLAKKLFLGDSIDLEDGLKILEEYLWKGNETFSSVGVTIPASYASGVGTYTSSTQQLDKLKTLVEVVYANDSLNSGDSYVADVFEDFGTLGTFITSKEANGPFTRLIRAIGYSLADRQVELEDLRQLFDIENCPEDYLPSIADLIGWRLIGTNPSRWRTQLRSAIEIYKAKGTIKSIQLVANTIFGESVFDVSSENLVELYESYIPFLIYYALATDSLAFANGGKNWTKDVANFLGVEEYSTQGLDFNLRLAVDYIILDLVKNYPQLFKIGNKPFDVGNPEFVFNYRNRTFSIPPWDEEKYYVNCNITADFLDYLKERLVCFGVTEVLAEEIKDFIFDNTIASVDYYSVESQWVFFTSAQEYASNYETVLLQPDKKRVEYLPLWNGRSSTINLPFFASSFDFTKKQTTEPDGAYTLQELVAGIDQVVPANAIQNIILSLSTLSDDLNLDDVVCPRFEPTFRDLHEASGEYAGFAVSGANMQAGGQTFKRADVDQNSDTLIQAAPLYAPRNSLRRRNQEHTFPRTEAYLRTGFNMPCPVTPSALEYSCPDPSNVCWIPLGYNPSAGDFFPVWTPLTPTGVWGECSDLESSAVFFGVPVSATAPARGRGIIPTSGCDEFAKRSHLEDIHKLLYDIRVSGAKITADYIVDADPSTYPDPSSNSQLYFNHRESITNDIISKRIKEFEKNEDFVFGRGLHSLWNIYTNNYANYGLGLAEKAALLKDNTHILNHIYGSILYNSKFDIDGSAISTDETLLTSSLSSINFFTASADDVFSSSVYASSIGTTRETAALKVLAGAPEFRNHHILSGVDLIMQEGTSVENKMAILKLSSDSIKKNKSTYHLDNPIVYLRTVEDLPRIRFSVKDFGARQTFLLPDNEYSLNLNVYGGDDAGLTTGGISFGVWIYTEYRNGYVWVYKPNGKWVREQVTTTNLNVPKITNDFSHNFHIPEETLDTSTDTGLKCIDFKIVEVSGEPQPLTINNLTEENITTYTVKFNTNNLPICIPQDHYADKGQVHRRAEDYYIEVFMLPKASHSNRFMLIDEVSLVNDTLQSKAVVKAPLGVPRYNFAGFTDYPLASSTMWDYNSDLQSPTVDSLSTVYFENTINSRGGRGAYVFKQRGDCQETNYIRADYGPPHDEEGEQTTETQPNDPRIPGITTAAQKLSVNVKYHSASSLALDFYDRAEKDLSPRLLTARARFEFVDRVPIASGISYFQSTPTRNYEADRIYSWVEPTGPSGAGWYRLNLVYYATSESIGTIRQIFMRPNLVETSIAQEAGKGTFLELVQQQNDNLDLPYQSIDGMYYKYEPLNFPETEILLSPSELLVVFRYFKSMAEGFASRQALISSGVFETSGGSRLNYRANPDWRDIGTRDTGGENNFSSIDLNGV